MNKYFTSHSFLAAFVSLSYHFFSLFLILALSTGKTVSQPLYPVALKQQVWHGKERLLRYQPDGDGFVIVNGNRRFTRALYGTNTTFRVEAGDLPEFALYMPGMGGNLKFGISAEGKSKWLIEAQKTTARYRPGTMLYEIEDPLLGKGKLRLEVLALSEADGLVVKAHVEGLKKPVQLFWVFGGASGKKFSRDGDMGADPESSFYLQPEYCTNNRYELKEQVFTLFYGASETASATRNAKANSDYTTSPNTNATQKLVGVMPPLSEIRIVDANQQASPQQLFESKSSPTPVITGRLKVTDDKAFYFTVQNPETGPSLAYTSLPHAFEKAEQARKKIASRIKVSTPDAYVNTYGGALSMAADAIWETPSYLHGSIGWRMRLNGWRGASVADPLGWHDRAQTHFKAYAASQVTSPASGPVVPDTALHFARQREKMGTALFSSGYISRNPGGDQRPHHYDMNLVFIDQVLSHFYWTGDLAFIKEMWPVIKRHLAWEKRNFDQDNDGLYDAYAAIWASDALQYSGSSVTHSSAYNYRANRIAAELAKLVGEDPAPYQQEATTIHKAINARLWMPTKGWYAEYQDLLGLQRLHPSAALWTIYHSIDSDVPDAFQAYQSLRYVDTQIPHIPLKAKGLADGYYTISTSNWMPYTWSINNVALAEVLHTTLANWQAGRNEEAYQLWKSVLLENMYLGGSPGNFGQISFYDAARGETYRDFADPIGMAARSLVEGLFGIVPNALEGTLTIRPGLPAAWEYASLATPDVAFDFKRKDQTDYYTITPSFNKTWQLKLKIKARAESIKTVLVNGKKASWTAVSTAIGEPMIDIVSEAASKYQIEITWTGAKPTKVTLEPLYAKGSTLTTNFGSARILKVADPQGVLQNTETKGGVLNATIQGEKGSRTVFVQLQQGQLSWWYPLCFEVQEPVSLVSLLVQEKNSLHFQIQNHTASPIEGKVTINTGPNAYVQQITIGAKSPSADLSVPATALVAGSNRVTIEWGENFKISERIINWNIENSSIHKLESIPLTSYFNDKVNRIFKNQYLSPRPTSPTLQLPIQGIGDWCYPLRMASIDDTGLRKLAGSNNRVVLPQGIFLQTPSDTNQSNIVFTSQWDNYPREVTIPLAGNASHAYFLMAGSTNPMQSQFDNGEVVIDYADGSTEKLVLQNPETWWPIEQDYQEDGYAFTRHTPKPIRIHLKTGLITGSDDTTFNGKAIAGGAATVLDLALDPSKKLKSLRLKTLANDVVIGLMSATLVR